MTTQTTTHSERTKARIYELGLPENYWNELGDLRMLAMELAKKLDATEAELKKSVWGATEVPEDML
jgi:hypothetical protein